MSIEQFEISLGSRIVQVPARQNLKAVQYQEAKRKALEAAKVKEAQEANGVAVQEELIVHEPVVQEVINSIIELNDSEVTEEKLHAEYNTDEFAKLVPEVLPAQDSVEDALEDSEGTSEDALEDVSEEPVEETELYIEEMLDLSEGDEDIVLVHESTVLELDDDNFEIQEIREIQEENK